MSTKRELEQDNQELRTQLANTQALLNAKQQTAREGIPMVPIRNYGGTVVTVTYDVFGTERACLMEPSGMKQFGSIPLERWQELERGSKLVSDGYIARTDRPITNPNIIEDVEEFIADIAEDKIETRIAEFTNANALYKINDFLAPRELEGELGGKELFLLTTVRDQIFELVGTKIVGKDPMGD
jgi:hypothetical protein